jgi:hypothetical protein
MTCASNMQLKAPHDCFLLRCAPHEAIQAIAGAMGYCFRRRTTSQPVQGQ